MVTPDKLIELLPLASTWVTEQESYILESGVSLTATQMQDAKLISVKHPEKVKLLKVDSIPLPTDLSLKAAAQEMSLITSRTAGLTLGYGIFVRCDYWENRKIIIHELVHVSQYERLGGISGFLQKYLTECFEFGYPQAPMEQEAISKANKYTFSRGL